MRMLERRIVGVVTTHVEGYYVFVCGVMCWDFLVDIESWRLHVLTSFTAASSARSKGITVQMMRKVG